MSSARLLLIVDDAVTVASYGRYLRSAGYAVTAAGSSHDGLTLLRSGHFDVVITDQTIAGTSALELLEGAKECHPPVPVIMYTPRVRESASVANQLLETMTGLQSAMPIRQPVGPASRRWMALVIGVIDSEDDLPTLSQWSTRVGHSIATIKRSCAAVGVHAAASLDFARALRIVVRHGGRRVDNWYDVLAISDSKTMARFLDGAGFDVGRRVPPPIADFVRTQRFVGNAPLLDAVVPSIARRSVS